MDFLGAIDTGLLVLVIGVLFVGASVLVGWTVFYVVRSQEKSASRRPQTSSRSIPPPPPAPAERSVEKPEDKEAMPVLREQFAALGQVGRRASVAPVEVMRLLRDRVTGALVVEVEGEKYRALKEIKDGRVGRRVLQVAADLVRFTEVMQPKKRTGIQQQSYTSGVDPTLAVSPSAPSTLALKIAPAMEQEPPVPRTPAPPSVEQEFLDSLTRQMQQGEREPEKPSLNPIEFFRRGFAARRTARLQSGVSSRSFIDEIEDILQRFIRTYPSFIGQEVHVGTAPDGGIRIQVENEFYSSPDDIPDPEIRGILKAAIQEWEKS